MLSHSHVARVLRELKLDSLWSLNPDAHVAFQSLGGWSILLMLAVGTGCALTAIGLWRGDALGDLARTNDSPRSTSLAI